ncbi:hypothetical protein LCI18_007464 [Fusarium solani-melongenae]|uniref:Uncharacterized protein n=1 Tax=Fusarium solani subsp. cucurbitae TaxID=2747967 RepID=A0ACD3Z5K4_FUSSC|nr:hypothetical protein LCI18_007464 [Fusarium solani-melongenae]
MGFPTNTILFRILALAVAVCATTTATTPKPTTLPGLISEIPSCVAGCLESIHEEIGCDPANIGCLCSDVGSLVAKMGPCIIKHGCELDEASNGTDLIRPVCDRMGDKPDDAEVVSASKVLDAAIATQATADASSTSTNAARNVGYDTIKLFAAGAVAALVI